MGSVPIYETNQNTFIPYATNSPINSMCEVTGGRSYLISTQRMLYQCLESLVGKIQAGVVINFEKFGNDSPSLRMTIKLYRLRLIVCGENIDVRYLYLKIRLKAM